MLDTVKYLKQTKPVEWIPRFIEEVHGTYGSRKFLSELLGINHDVAMQYIQVKQDGTPVRRIGRRALLTLQILYVLRDLCRKLNLEALFQMVITAMIELNRKENGNGKRY